MPESASSRSTSPSVSGDVPKPRVVSDSLRDRIAKFNNTAAPPPLPTNPYVGNVSMQSSYARGGLVGNRLPSLDPKTAGLSGQERRRTPSDVGRGMPGNRVPSSSASNSGATSTPRPGSGMGSTSTTTSVAASGTVSAAPSTTSARSNSPTESATSSAPASSSAAIDSASITTSRSSSPATSPDVQLPPQLLVSSLPDTMDAGAMTPSSTIAEAGEETFERSMPATPIASAVAELPPPVHDLVPGNLTLAGGPADMAAASTPSLSSSLASQYDPESVTEEEDNLKDVSGVSTPTGTPRQAHRDLDDRSVTGSSVAGSTRSGDADEIEDRIKRLEVDDNKVKEAEIETETEGGAPLSMERTPTPTAPDALDSAVVGAPLAKSVSPQVVEAEEALKKAEDAATAAEAAVKPAQQAVTNAEGSSIASPTTPIVFSPLTPTVGSAKDETKEGEEAKDEPMEVEPKVDTAGVDAHEDKGKEEETTPTEESVKTDVKTDLDAAALVAAPAAEKDSEPELTASEPTETSQVDTKLAGQSEVLTDTKSASNDVAKDDALDTLADDLPRNSADTLRPMEFSRGTDSTKTSPVVVPDELRGSLDPDTESATLIERDRDATPQPPGNSDDERQETPSAADGSETTPPALDDTSDVVSLSGVEHAFETEPTHVYDASSNRSSMPPARASSELEFRYEEYADQFFRDQQQREHAAGVDATIAAGGAGAAAIVGDNRRETPATNVVTQETRPESAVKDNAVVSPGGEKLGEKHFPSVPTDNFNVDGTSSSAHKPTQVHIEPSPYGPVSEHDKNETSSATVNLNSPLSSSPPTPPPDLVIQAPSPHAPTFNTFPSTQFPTAPSTDLPEVKTPVSSIAPSRTPTPPKRTSSLQGRVLPPVPDEQHPYISVHVSPHSSSNTRSTDRTLSPTQSPSRSNSPHLSIDSATGTPRKKRNSFTPRSPHLDDEDPGDFEPGEGWAVVTDWSSWRGSPPRDPLPETKSKQQRGQSRWRRSFAEVTGRR